MYFLFFCWHNRTFAVITEVLDSLNSQLVFCYLMIVGLFFLGLFFLKNFFRRVPELELFWKLAMILDCEGVSCFCSVPKRLLRASDLFSSSL